MDEAEGGTLTQGRAGCLAPRLTPWQFYRKKGGPCRMDQAQRGGRRLEQDCEANRWLPGQARVE
ncbi:uncharacterized protein POS17_5171 [Pseudomonas sp. Os17]|nr:uncharacterized protein POS17_5171 [Pseudomonas sp. Os17]